MHHYKHHIGDYRRDTAHLSLLEHGCYRQLLDMYYLSENPIPKETETVMRRLCARTEDEIKAVEIVLSEFFTLTENGYVHKRCEHEIDAYQSRADGARESGKLGGRPKKTVTVISENRDGYETEPDEKLTTNQEPLTKNHKSSSALATRLPADWSMSVEECEFCTTTRPDLNALETANRFRDYWIAQPGAKGRKLDWSATWRNWVRNEKQVKTSAPLTADVKPWFLTASGIEQHAESLNLRKSPDEAFPMFKARVYQAAGVTPDMLRQASAEYRT